VPHRDLSYRRKGRVEKCKDYSSRRNTNRYLHLANISDLFISLGNRNVGAKCTYREKKKTGRKVQGSFMLEETKRP
jgi:hypothetical protein